MAKRAGWNVCGPWTGGARSGQVQWPIHHLRFKQPVAAHAYARLKRTFPKKRFTRRGEKSDDGNTWSEFMVVEAYRSKQKQPILSRTTSRQPLIPAVVASILPVRFGNFSCSVWSN